MSSQILRSRLEGSTLVVETEGGTETYDSKFLVAAMLIDVARGNGQIEQEESSQIIDLLEAHFHIEGAESLELITRTMSEMDEEDVALMGLKVIAADGQREISEMEQFNKAMTAMSISPDIVHRAFDRYFAATTPGK
jgi:uncharacterized tellurite resistance protein B-like protein